MTYLVAFALTLLVAVLLSERAERTVLSIAVLFIAAGFLIGPGLLGLVELELDDPSIRTFVEVALFVVLFVDGMHLSVRQLRSIWPLAGRALALGLPLTMVLVAILAHYVTGLTWIHSLLVAAILSPTDPVFASALVKRNTVPKTLRRLLNVESGINDGLALPIILTVLAFLGATEFKLGTWLAEIALGIFLGLVVPYVVIRLERLSVFEAVEIYMPITVIAIGLLLFALARLLAANIFLTAFPAGIVIVTLGPKFHKSFKQLGEITAELLKLASLLILGALLSTEFLEALNWSEIIFALLVIVAARPLALMLVMRGSELPRSQRLAAAWFGPRGFASVVYGLLLLTSNVEQAGGLFRIIATVVVISIAAHSSTDALVARWISGEGGSRPANQEEEERRFA